MKERIISYLRENDNFFIATHINPEGDALGSAIALSMALGSMEKKSLYFDKDPVPEFYNFMPGSEGFLHSVPADTSSLTLILVDCNDPERAALEGVRFKYCLVIDHHETEREFGDIKWIEPYAPATGLMVYNLIKGLGVKITKDIAVNLYTAIAVDTGIFRYRNTTPEVLGVAAELAGAGAEPGSIAEGIYETWSEARLRLLAKALGTLRTEDGFATIEVTKEMFRETEAQPSDTENFSNFPRLVKTIQVSALFRQLDGNSYKVSLRSKGRYNVAKIAEGFGGGGHKNAAGYKVDADIESARKALLKALKNQKQ